VDDMFRTDSRSLILNLWRWGAALVSGGNIDSKHTRSLVDTQPLRSYLKDVLHTVNGEITGSAYNLETGRLKAAAISTSRYSTGQSITWVQGKGIDIWWTRTPPTGRRWRSPTCSAATHGAGL